MSNIWKSIAVHFAIVLCSQLLPSNGKYLVDDLDGLWTTFDGIGGISGGGATSKLLINYKEPERSYILDYLFRPKFAASLQILKVEIGGDSQSGDGSESSHMHTPFDENYNRGYEWWMMKEAKKRNPSIKLYGLPWAFPGWIGGGRAGHFNPYYNRTATVRYIMNWIHGAWREHQLKINYIGVWNERSIDKEYVKLLRATLDAEGHRDIRIIVPDAQDWSFMDDVESDPDYLNAFNIIGQHYPGATTPDAALRLDKTLWASEEYSAYNNLVGAACWARVLVESPVNGFYSGFIAWNLIASYYENFPWNRDSLMTANQPWSGHYEVNAPIWMTAHHTQFAKPGWFYLRHGRGVEQLRGNGTFVSMTSPDRRQLTIVIQAVNPYEGICFYRMPTFHVSDEQVASFTLSGSFSGIRQLYVWYSFLNFTAGATQVLFEKRDPITVRNREFSLVVRKNEIYTLTTVADGQRGDHGTPPPSAPFPVPYLETFEGYQVEEEPFNLAQQAGAFQVNDLGDPVHGKVMTQVVTELTVDTCCTYIPMPRPVTVIGDFYWTNVSVEVDVLLPSSNDSGDVVFLASNLQPSGCGIPTANATHLWMSAKTGVASLTGNHAASIVYGSVTVSGLTYDRWFTVGLDVMGNNVTATFNRKTVLNLSIKNMLSWNGFVAFGTERFGVAHFDNFRINRAHTAVVQTQHELQ